MTQIVAPVVNFHLDLAADLGTPLQQNAVILDLGCGVGATVEAFRSAGYKAYGVDIERDLDTAEHRIRSATGANAPDRMLRHVELSPYRIPFDDATFDYVFSEQVFEHVMNYEECLAENWRVLKPGGFSLHVFPSRWRPIEPHVFVPFGGVFQDEAYLRIWSRLGIRNGFQRGMEWRDVARRNAEYLRTGTNYLSKREIESKVAAVFEESSWEELAFTRRSFGRSRMLYPVFEKVTPLLTIFRTLHTRVLCLRKRG